MRKLLNSLRQKKVRQQTSVRKVMLMDFFDRRGIVYQHIVPQGQTINMSYYESMVNTMRKHLGKKMPEPKKKFILHRDNA